MPEGELISVTIGEGIKKFSELGRHDNSNDDKSKYKKVCVGDIAYNSSAIGAVMLVYGGIKFAMAFRQMDQQGEHQAVYSVVAGGVLVGLSALVTALT